MVIATGDNNGSDDFLAEDFRAAEEASEADVPDSLSYPDTLRLQIAVASRRIGRLESTIAALEALPTIHPIAKTLAAKTVESSRADSAEKLLLQVPSQIKNLVTATLLGVVEVGEEQKLGYVGLNEAHQPEFFEAPTAEEIAEAMQPEHREAIEYKLQQGLAKLYISPFNQALYEYMAATTATLQSLDLEDSSGHPLIRNSSGSLVAIDAEVPFDPAPVFFAKGFYMKGVDHNGSLVYRPGAFNRLDYRVGNRNRVTKSGMLAKQFKRGYRLFLSHEDPDAMVNQTIGDRTPLPSWRIPGFYLSRMAHPPYLYEAGHTPETWMTELLTHILEKGEVIDDLESETGGAGCFLIDSFFQTTQEVPTAFWMGTKKQLCMATVGTNIRAEQLRARGIVDLDYILTTDPKDLPKPPKHS